MKRTSKKEKKKIVFGQLIFWVWMLCLAVMIQAAPSSREIISTVTVTGSVSVNGQVITSGATVKSGSKIVTAANSSAIIKLDKIGTVEILNDSVVTLNYTGNSITGALSSGSLRATNSIATRIAFNTANSLVLANEDRENSFLIDVGCGDTDKCAQTYVETFSGMAIIRNGSNDKQVAAGTDATLGNPSQQGCKACFRAGSNQPRLALIIPSNHSLYGLLFGVGGGAGGLAALVAATGGDNDLDQIIQKDPAAVSKLAL